MTKRYEDMNQEEVTQLLRDPAIAEMRRLRAFVESSDPDALYWKYLSPLTRAQMQVVHSILDEVANELYVKVPYRKHDPHTDDND